MSCFKVWTAPASFKTTLAGATKVAAAVFEKTGVVVAITEIKTKVKVKKPASFNPDDYPHDEPSPGFYFNEDGPHAY